MQSALLYQSGPSLVFRMLFSVDSLSNLWIVIFSTNQRVALPSTIRIAAKAKPQLPEMKNGMPKPTITMTTGTHKANNLSICFATSLTYNGPVQAGGGGGAARARTRGGGAHP